MEIFIRGLVALGIALAVATIGFSDTVAPPQAAAQGDNGQGWSPCMKALFGKFGNRCGGCGSKGAAPAQNQPRHTAVRTQPGTVVFPQHPFARSPRDFFMVD